MRVCNFKINSLQLRMGGVYYSVCHSIIRSPTLPTKSWLVVSWGWERKSGAFFAVEMVGHLCHSFTLVDMMCYLLDSVWKVKYVLREVGLALSNGCQQWKFQASL